MQPIPRIPTLSQHVIHFVDASCVYGCNDAEDVEEQKGLIDGISMCRSPVT